MLKKFLPNSLNTVLTFLSFLLLTLPAQSQPDVSYQPFIGVSEGLNSPIQVVSAPGDVAGRLFIVEKAGIIRIWNGNNLLPTPFLDISSLVVDEGEQGLLSMAFHPQYSVNGFFFVYYNDDDGNITIARYHVSADPDIAETVANPTTPLISIPKNFDNHNGGHMQFRIEASTNFLYFATGDGGDDPNPNAQDPGSYLGKMIRVNVDVTPYTPEIWAMGLRNPFRWSFDRTTGDIWIGDVGQSSKEEINFRALGTGGANYGWPCVEGTEDYSLHPASLDCPPIRAIDVLPVLDYDNPADGRSVVGGYVYRGTEFAALQGYYIATDFYTGRLWLIRQNGTGWDIDERTGFPTGIASISETSNGTLYAVSLTGNIVYKIVTPIVTPLNLISFSGTSMSGYNDLKWVTESEENIDRYVVEYSTDGRSYSSVGEVLSENSVNRNTYPYRHNIVNTTTVYYRLKISELSGAYEYSPVITIGADTKAGLRIYPTSITNGLVNIVSLQPVQKIIITNTTGLQLFSKEMSGASGYFNIVLPALQKGLYFIQVSGKGFQKTEKLIVQ